MNCYEFELNLSNFIEGELKQKEIINFRTHQKGCVRCSEKLESMVEMLLNLGNFKTINISNNFTRKLHHKISALGNEKFAKPWNLSKILFFGLEPKHAISFSFSIILVVSSLFYFFQIDEVPKINMVDYQINEVNKSNLNSNLITDHNPSQFINSSDSVNNEKSKQNSLKIFNNTPQIKTVNSKK